MRAHDLIETKEVARKLGISHDLVLLTMEAMVEVTKNCNIDLENVITEDKKYGYLLTQTGFYILIDVLLDEKDYKFNGMVNFLFDRSGTKCRRKCYYKNGRFHRKNKPAVIEYYEDGELMCEKWYKNGEYHREDGPADISYHKNGKVSSRRWCIENNFDSKNVPTCIGYHENGKVESVTWYKDNKYHRENGPANIWFDEHGNITCEEYVVNGVYHREDGPAEICYYENGKVEYWYQRGHGIHREDGPAIIEYDEDGNIINQKFYFNNVEINELQQIIMATK